MPDPTLILLAVMGLLFIVGMIGAARSMFEGSDPVVERLRGGAATGFGVQQQAAPITKERNKVAMAEDVGGASTRVQKQLMHANITHPRALQFFLVAKVALATALPTILLAYNLRKAEPWDMALPVAVLLGMFGLFLPNIWLSGRVSKRQTEISKSLPDALDLLVTCVEAGLGLDAALSRVASEIRHSSPILADEFRTTFLEIGAGMQRVRAFRRLAERTGVEDVRSLSATLTQTERFGTSVASALRIRSEWMRTRRMQVAEEKAAVVSVKMTVPLVLCILPSLIAVIMGPAAVRIIENLMPNMGG